MADPNPPPTTEAQLRERREQLAATSPPLPRERVFELFSKRS